MSDNPLKWLNSTGGPLILMERQGLRSWRGSVKLTENQTAGDVLYLSDYDRACSVEDYVGVIPVGSSQALIFNDEPLQTTWWPVDKRGGIVVRWRWAPNQEAIVDVMSKLAVEWENTGIDINYPKGDLIIFDSALHFEEVDASLDVQLEPGTYAVQTAEYEPNQQVSLLFHLLTLI